MAKSVIEAALESIDRDIAALQRAKDIIIAASLAVPLGIHDQPKAKRGRPRKKGLPANENLHLDPRSGI